MANQFGDDELTNSAVATNEFGDALVETPDKQPDDFMVDKTPELAKVTGDEPKVLKEKIEKAQRYSELTGMPFKNTYDLHYDLPDIKPVNFDVTKHFNDTLKDAPPEEEAQQQQGFKNVLWEFARPFVAEGYVAASAVNRGMAGFSEHLDSIGDFLIDDLGLGTKGDLAGLFEEGAKYYEKNAEYWAKRADEVGVTFIDEMVGEAVGGAIPGVTSFVLDVSSLYTIPFMAGYANDERKGTQYPLASGLTEAAKTMTLHKLFGMMQPLKQYLKAPTMGGVFGLQEMEAAEEGGKARAFAKGWGMGAGYSLSSPGGHMGLRKIKGNMKPYIDKAKELIVKDKLKIEEMKENVLVEKDKFDALQPEQKLEELPKTAEKIGRELEKEIPQKKGLFKTAIKEVEKERLAKTVEKEVVKKDTEESLSNDIKVLENELGVSSKVSKTAKHDIRKSTGQIKVKDIESIDTRQALKDQLKLESKVAREAFKAGNLKATLEAKTKQRETMVKLRQQREVTDMRKWLQKTHKMVKKGQQFSNATQKTLEDIYSGLDTTKMQKGKKLSLEKTQEFLKNNPLSDLPERVMADLERLNKKGISELTYDDMQSLYTAVKNQVHLEKNKNRIKAKRRASDLGKVRDKVVSEMRPAKEIKNNLLKEQEQAKTPETKAQVAKKGIKEFLTKRQLGYDTFVEYVFGLNSTGYDIFFRQIKQGTRARLKYQHESLNNFIKDIGGLKLDKPVDQWLNEPIQVKGTPYAFTRGERMSLYRHSLNADNKAALLKGGFGYKARPEKRFTLSERHLNKITKDLSPQELKMAGEPVDNFFKNQLVIMNKAHVQANGYDMPLDKGGRHFPKSVMTMFTEAEQQPFKFSDNMTRVGVPKGRTKKRQNSKAPIYIEDMTQVMNETMKEASTYAFLEQATSNASKLLYDKNFKREFLKRHDKNTWVEIEKGLRDIIGQRQQFNSFDKSLMFIKNNLATGVLGMNPFVVALQPASFPMYGIYIEPKYLKQALAEFARHPKKMSEEIAANSPDYTERVSAGYNVDIQDAIGKRSTLFGGSKSITEKIMTPIQMADKMAVTPGTRAGVLKVLTEIKEGKIDDIVSTATGYSQKEILRMNEAQQTAVAYEFADWVTAKTQPMFSPEHRSSISRGSAMERLVSMFGSATSRFKDVMVSTGMDAHRLKQLQQEAIKKTNHIEDIGERQVAAKERFAKSLFAVLVVNTAAIMTRDEIRNALYNRESKLGFASKVMKSWSGLMFGVRDVSGAVFRSLDKGTSYGVDVQMSPVSIIPDLTAKAIFNMVDAMESGDEKAAIRAVDNTLNLILTGRYGLPYQPVKSLTKIGKKKKKRRANL